MLPFTSQSPSGWAAEESDGQRARMRGLIGKKAKRFGELNVLLEAGAGNVCLWKLVTAPGTFGMML